MKRFPLKHFLIRRLDAGEECVKPVDATRPRRPLA
jgi:hypothetical protein